MNTKKDYTKEYITIPDTDEKDQRRFQEEPSGSYELIPYTFADPPGGVTKANSCGDRHLTGRDKKYPPITSTKELVEVICKEESKHYDKFVLSYNTRNGSVYICVGSVKTDYILRNENSKRRPGSWSHRHHILLSFSRTGAQVQTSVHPPPPTSHIEEKLLSKVERIKSTLGLDAELSIIESIRQANKYMGLSTEGTLPMQADALLDELGI